MGRARDRTIARAGVIAVLAASAALVFAPPLDRPIRYETSERRPRPDGTLRGATLVQEVAFARDGDGYRMTIRTVGYRTTLAPEQSAPFDAVMKPMVGHAVTVHLSSGGVPERVIDGGACWDAMLASLRAQIAQFPPGADQTAPARTVLGALEATSPTARDARLIATADDLLGMRLPPIAAGTQVAAPDGTIARADDAGGEARYRERTRHVADGRALETDSTVAVSRATGLVVHSLRRTAVAAAPHALLLSESETREVPR